MNYFTQKLNFIVNVDNIFTVRLCEPVSKVCFEFAITIFDTIFRSTSVKQSTLPFEIVPHRPVLSQSAESPFLKVLPTLSSSAVINVILMFLEARQQACLPCTLRTISECQVCDYRTVSILFLIKTPTYICIHK